MAKLLYRLGMFSARHPWRVLVGWLVVLGLAGGAFLAFGGSLASSLSIPGTETTRVTDQLKHELDTSGGATGTVVFSTKDGAAFTAQQKSDITTLLKRVDGVHGVDGTIDPFTTAAQRAAQQQKVTDGVTQLAAAKEQLAAGQQQLDAAVAQAKAAGVYQQASAQLTARQRQLDETSARLAGESTTLDASQQLLDASAGIRTVSKDGTAAVAAVEFHDDLYTLSPTVKSAVADKLDHAGISGVQVNYSSEIANSLDGILGPGEITGVVIAFIVLIVMLRALLPAVMPLVTSLIGVGVGVAGSLAFSNVVDMSSVTPVLGVMLGLAVGIDYALFIINRHRRQLLAGVEVRESIGLANGTSGNAVVFAGSTVLVALLALNITGIGFLGVMGTVGAVCVAVAVLIAVSLTPALLGMLGPRVLGRKARSQIGQEQHAARVVKPMRTSRAILTVVLAVAGLLVIAIPALSMRLGLPDGSSESPTSTQYKAYSIVADKFGAGVNGPLVVTATLPHAVSQSDVVLAEAQVSDALMAHPDIVAVAPVGVSHDRDFLAFQVVPAGGPSSESTEQLVHDLRASSPISVTASVDGGSASTATATPSPVDGRVTLGVAGEASGNIDISEILASALPIYLAVVVGLSLLIMIVVFRSLLVPVLATGGYVLSLFAAFGGMTAVYQWGWLGQVFGVHDPGPVLSFAPIIVMGVLFGLAMDYQLFLVSGMREAYVHGLPARGAVVAGLRNGRAVVTAAAIIMVSVFGGFVFSELTMVRPLGFGLAFGVLFDAFVVRMLLVPSLMHLAGKGAWWLPKWLERILPNVDVEGAALERTHSIHGIAEEPENAEPPADTTDPTPPHRPKHRQTPASA